MMIQLELEPSTIDYTIEIIKNINGAFELQEVDHCDRVFTDEKYVKSYNILENVDDEIKYQTNFYEDQRVKKMDCFLSRVKNNENDVFSNFGSASEK